jgi:hypothetical protein
LLLLLLLKKEAAAVAAAAAAAVTSGAPRAPAQCVVLRCECAFIAVKGTAQHITQHIKAQHHAVVALQCKHSRPGTRSQ